MGIPNDFLKKFDPFLGLQESNFKPAYDKILNLNIFPCHKFYTPYFNPILVFYDATLKIDENVYTHLTDYNHQLAVFPKFKNDILSHFNTLKVFNGIREISLSSQFTKNLLDFLKTGRKDDNTFNCFDFINKIKNYKTEQKIFDPDQWEITEISEEVKPEKEDLIMIYNKGDEPKHFAVFLEDEIYLSLIGAIGPLTASSLTDLKAHYSCAKAAIIKKK